MENIYYRGLNTDLELNGPILSFLENPVGVGSTVTGSVTETYNSSKSESVSSGVAETYGSQTTRATNC